MSGWTTSKNCLYCQNKFEARRSDAQFCSSRCRTGHHRREQKREKMLGKILNGAWDGNTKGQFEELKKESPQMQEFIIDFAIKHGPDAAGAAAYAAYSAMLDQQAKAHEQINRRDHQIKKLENQVELLDKIKRLIN